MKIVIAQSLGIANLRRYGGVFGIKTCRLCKAPSSAGRLREAALSPKLP
jgi:hypothetical protein